MQAGAVVFKVRMAHEAELYRIWGEPEYLPGGNRQAEARDLQASEVARDQEARSLEFRAATRHACLWHSQDNTTEARDLLAPVYGWFTEGFDTADLKEAMRMAARGHDTEVHDRAGNVCSWRYSGRKTAENGLSPLRLRSIVVSSNAT